ncbi:hypothetical protein BHE74_00043396 [Ensete ventricosum]|nr:hypothetical protein GW17_00057727 [Ensete ventricosum]RWW50360.1 hypothetical protein BHE74_00043396 [Ensete ventricosum]RZR91872.1 hypothetical protein BHM03_00020054 [Ensete ventricosum]
MSQEHPSTNLNLEHLGDHTHLPLPTLHIAGPSLHLPVEETSALMPTPNRYWRLLNDPGTGISTLIANHGPPHVSVEAFLGFTHQVQADCTFLRLRTLRKPEHLGGTTDESLRDVAQVPPNPDVISSDSTDLVREQLRQVNQRLDEVRRQFAKSKEEVGKSSKAGSPFVPEIQDEPVPPDFRLPT